MHVGGSFGSLGTLLSRVKLQVPMECKAGRASCQFV
jgi:hypothetical protein